MSNPVKELLARLRQEAERHAPYKPFTDIDVRDIDRLEAYITELEIMAAVANADKGIIGGKFNPDDFIDLLGETE